ncbi:streptomycin 6-kinase [Asanoa ishikariensis]|uniref:Streptomycin 6-kinase n=1 Tax=Asanoa ishikariensis TaxID=137265 RepID=A0A1H3PE25_9ACTN|nr:aminoglycoside phosphotransferase family protein [Asanoa ishikariensis]GIF67887.1 streptomycin 6-kinase [Asanoa ishikariensis]SDY99193.1 streptomycin 6-kinase [Asanoa ishikariensis]
MSLVRPTLPVVRQLGGLASAQPWLASLPALVEEVRTEFDLRLSPPLHGGSCSWVAPASLPDGTPVIVKIGWPHREMLGEPAALRRWNGRGAVRLIASDPQRHALVLERCLPGDQLASAGGPAEERLSAGCGVLRSLWSAPLSPPIEEIEELATVTAEWADLVEERMDRLRPGYDPGLVAEGARLLRELPASADRRVLLHGDFNPGNVLAARGGTWVAIDPKPMVGDPAYDPWPMLEQISDPFATADPTRTLWARCGVLADELALEADRIVRWSVARRVETALWAAHHGNIEGGAAIMREARILANL